MVFNNKKAQEIGINFIVILIIAIVVFGFGIYFAAKIFSSANQIKKDIDQETQLKLQEALRSGQKVSIAPTTAQVRPGDSAIFGLGIINLIGCPRTFYIETSNSKTDVLNGNLSFLYTKSQLIGNSEEQILPILVQVPGVIASGTYSADVVVSTTDCNGATIPRYGTAQKIFVKI